MDIPEGAIEFNKAYDSQEKCLALLEKVRWPNGFICPNCGHDDGYRLNTRPLIQCTLCRSQASVTSGTVFHKTHLPLPVWFYIIFSTASDKGGSSSCRIAAELAIQQKTVWNILHKLRHAMGLRDELIRLAGFIELDEAVLGPHARRPTISAEDKVNQTDAKVKARGRKKKDDSRRKTQTDVLVLVEQERQSLGVAAMKVLDSVSAASIKEVLERRVDENQYIKCDGLQAHHNALRGFNCSYKAVVCSGPAGLIELPIVHRAISLLKLFLMGTYFGVSKKHLQSYLNEFCFRLTRKDSSKPIWLSILRACVFATPITQAEINT